MMLLKIFVVLLLGVSEILSLKGPLEEPFDAELAKWMSFEFRPTEKFSYDNFLKSEKHEESKIKELEQPEKNLLSVAERPEKKSLHKPKRQISPEKNPELILSKGIDLLQDSAKPEISQELDKKQLKTPTLDRSSDLPKLEETIEKGAETKPKLKDNRGESLLEDAKLSDSSLGNQGQHLESSIGKDQTISVSSLEKNKKLLGSSLGKDEDKNIIDSSLEQNKGHSENLLGKYGDPKASLGDDQKSLLEVNPKPSIGEDRKPSLGEDRKPSLGEDKEHSLGVNKISQEDSLTEDQKLLESPLSNEQEKNSLISEDKVAIKPKAKHTQNNVNNPKKFSQPEFPLNWFTLKSKDKKN